MKKNKVKLKGTPSTIISFRYVFILFIIALILMVTVPKILNYGPGTINTAFDIQMSYISYNTQYLLLISSISIIIIVFSKINLRDIDKWYAMSEKKRMSNVNEIKKIRKKCTNLPYIFYTFEIFLPPVIAFVVLGITGSHSIMMIGKIIILLMAFSLLLAVISFLFSKDLYDEILSKTYIEGYDIGVRISLRKKIVMLIFPVCLSGIFLTGLVGYSSSVIEKENVLFEAYNRILTEEFVKDIYTEEEIYSLAQNLELYDNNDIVFIMNPNYETNILTDGTISDFIIEYMKQLVDENEGRIYDSYGMDRQGCSIKLNTENGPYYVGIVYDIVSYTALKFLLVDISFLIIVLLGIILFWGNSLCKSLHQIFSGFKNICNNSSKTVLLPVISNDETGDLVMAFNDIQKLNTAHIEDIHKKQNMLIESERLASLGQMVGGIAHSLKTPIFSISGGVEGLTDLVNEFDSSIEDSTVNEQDMHEIAQDMTVWLQKIKTQLSYMSEVITTVKGQAVSLSGDDTVEFNVSELFSHTNILMKHELQSALVTLELENKVSDSVILKGNINSLVQVLNNLISNAIQAYNKEPNKKVELKAKKKDDNILISVKDYGPGLPDVVKDKIFKEMITTKGKEGTGLGIFMSHSLIKAKFNGDIKVQTSNKGTEFTIYLPINTI